jgi:hypothetical protein
LHTTNVSPFLQLVELALPMSEAMTAIYAAIGDLMAGCIKDLRSSNKVRDCG